LAIGHSFLVAQERRNSSRGLFNEAKIEYLIQWNLLADGEAFLVNSIAPLEKVRLA
jgi:hypothetical protein